MNAAKTGKIQQPLKPAETNMKPAAAVGQQQGMTNPNPQRQGSGRGAAWVADPARQTSGLTLLSHTCMSTNPITCLYE